MKIGLTLCCCVLASGCGIPKDADGTLDRVRAERRFKVGLVAGAPLGLDRQRALLGRIAVATSAKPELQADAAEPLLARLEEGELDLVIGPFAPKSPWGTDVTLLPPLAEQVSRDGHVVLAVAARNGENAWIGLLTREARAVAAAP